MSKRLRGITIEIGGDTKPLSEALEGVNKQSKHLQSELKDVERLLKLDPKNVELLTQRKKLLAEAVQSSADRLATLETAQKQAAQAFAEGKIGAEQYRAIQREVIEATSRLRTLQDQLADVNDRWKHAAERVKGFGQSVGRAGTALTPLSAAAGAALTGLVGMTVKSAQAADNINTLSKQTGLSVEEIQKFQYASARIDVPLGTLTSSMARLTRGMGAASEQIKAGKETLTGAALAFDKLGVEVTNADGSLRSNQDVLQDVITALAAKTNATERDALAMEIFGRSAQDLNPLILGGADALRTMGDEATALGLVLSQDTLDGLNAIDDELEKTKAQLAATGMVVAATIGAIVLPLLQRLAEFVQGVAARFREMDEGQARVIVTALAVVAGLAPVLIILGKVATAIGAIIALVPKIVAGFTAVKAIMLGTATKAGLLTSALAALKAVKLVLFGPIGLIIAAVAALAAGVYLLVKNWGTVQEFFSSLWASVLATFNATRDRVLSVVQSIWEGVTQRFANMVSGIRNVLVGVAEAVAAPFRRAWEAVSGIADRIRGALNKINPFARQSPSLVDNVRAGVAVIQREYAKLEDMRLPSAASLVAPVAPRAASLASASATVAATPVMPQGPLFIVQSMAVRSDEDIEAVSRQLFRHIQAATRARGGRGLTP